MSTAKLLIENVSRVFPAVQGGKAAARLRSVTTA